MPIGTGGQPSGVGTGGSMDCGGAFPETFPCPGSCNTIYDETLTPCLSQNCACYFNWENQNSSGEWNIIFPTDPLYANYCSTVNQNQNTDESCFAWGFDTQLKVSYEVSTTLQSCGGAAIPQKGWQRLRYAPSYYTSQNEGEEGNKFWFPFPIYDIDGTTPLKRPDGSEYTTELNAEVSACDCDRLMMFQDREDNLWKIKINPAKGRIVEDGVSNHMQLVAYFTLPNKAGTKGSDAHEHGFCIIDAIKDCDFAVEDQYCHGAGKRFNESDGAVNRPSDTGRPQCLGEFGIKEYSGSVWFVDSAGVATQKGTISQEDSKRTGVPYLLPPYSSSFGSQGLRLDSVLYNNFGAILFNVDQNAESTLVYDKNSTVLEEVTENSIELSKFYKTHCCGGGSERIANILLNLDRTAWEGDVVLPGFENCDPNTNPDWGLATFWFLNRWEQNTSITTQNLDSYKSTSDQYNGFERKLQNSIENYLAYVRSGTSMEYLGGAFACRGNCGRSCNVIESNIFDLVREKLCRAKTAKLIGFGGITLPEDTVTPKYHVPDTRLAGNNLNDFTYYCTNLTIDPTTKFGSFGATVTGSTLHKNNIISSNDYAQGRCMNVETPVGTILPYQDSNTGVVCSDYIATTQTNLNDQRCYWYWTQRFDNSSNDQTIPTSMEYHWLSGGYFYGNKELRDNVYKELGTIHFNTSVNINNFAYDITTADKTPKDYTIKINTATEYPDINTLWDIAQSHISVGFATSSTLSGGTGGTIVNGLTPVIKYNAGINGYFSAYSASSIKQYVDTLSLTPSKFTVEMGTEDTVKEDTNGIFVKLISSKTGSTTQWPKTDNYYTLNTPAQLSFLVDTGSGASYRNTYYNIVDSPTTVSTIPSDTGTPVTTLQYFANNAIESSMAFITDAIPITTYENYKFFGSIIDKNTIEISTNTSDIIYSNTNTKVTTTSTTKFDYLIDIKTQWDTNPDAIGFLNLYNYTTNGTNQINIVLDSTTTVFDGATISTFQLIKDPITGIINRILITVNEDIPDLLGFGYGLGYSRPFIIKLNSCYSGTTTNLNNQNKESVLTQNTLTNDLQYKPPSPIKSYRMDGSSYLADAEYPLFDLNSSKFSTPDYSFIKLSPVSEQSLNVEKIIPLRGAEYSTSEKQSYPTYRTIRKADGKYYLQILAGAFPYFHSVVHLPAIKGVSKGDNQDSAVEESLKKVCSKNIDWYNHVATTKWTCLVKHTQFSQNIPEWKSLVNTKAVNQIGKPIIIGRPGSAIINAGGSSGGRPILIPIPLDLTAEE